MCNAKASGYLKSMSHSVLGTCQAMRSLMHQGDVLMHFMRDQYLLYCNFNNINIHTLYTRYSLIQIFNRVLSNKFNSNVSKQVQMLKSPLRILYFSGHLQPEHELMA